MGIIRNFIDIEGITPEEELPQNLNEQMMIYSETENIFIPEDKNSIKNIFQIFVDLQVKANRFIKTPLGRILTIDGIKKLKFIYSEKNDEDKANILELQTPFNTFIELPKGIEEFESVDVYIIDAYFQLIGENKIYSYIMYFVNVNNRYKKTNEEIAFYNENAKIELSEGYKKKELENAMDGLITNDDVKFNIEEIELGKARIEYKHKNDVYY